MLNQISRVVDDIEWTIGVEDFPTRKRPILFVEVSGKRVKVGEITDDVTLQLAVNCIFHDAKKVVK